MQLIHYTLKWNTHYTYLINTSHADDIPV